MKKVALLFCLIVVMAATAWASEFANEQYLAGFVSPYADLSNSIPFGDVSGTPLVGDELQLTSGGIRFDARCIEDGVGGGYDRFHVSPNAPARDVWYGMSGDEIERFVKNRNTATTAIVAIGGIAVSLIPGVNVTVKCIAGAAGITAAFSRCRNEWK